MVSCTKFLKCSWKFYPISFSFHFLHFLFFPILSLSSHNFLHSHSFKWWTLLHLLKLSFLNVLTLSLFHSFSKLTTVHIFLYSFCKSTTDTTWVKNNVNGVRTTAPRKIAPPSQKHISIILRFESVYTAFHICGGESWQLCTFHPNIWKFLQVFKKEQALNEIIINQMLAGKHIIKMHSSNNRTLYHNGDWVRGVHFP